MQGTGTINLESPPVLCLNEEFLAGKIQAFQNINVQIISPELFEFSTLQYV